MFCGPLRTVCGDVRLPRGGLRTPGGALPVVPPAPPPAPPCAKARLIGVRCRGLAIRRAFHDKYCAPIRSSFSASALSAQHVVIVVTGKQRASENTVPQRELSSTIWKLLH